MDDATKRHIMRFDEREELREHMLVEHAGNLITITLIRNADHPELDDFHIQAHRFHGA